ncbi:MAG TPA: hemerythrin domain-containing protein, partial [Nitrospira sp.]|nr:hemerythrin domain-containing protein [Nitrospira sp.]
MTSITEPLHDHHKFCDELFADAEDSAHGGEWVKCQEAFDRFRNELEAHFSTEENDLFPAFERTTGMAGGPTHVMRIEHAQMRDLIGQMSSAL